MSNYLLLITSEYLLYRGNNINERFIKMIIFPLVMNNENKNIRITDLNNMFKSVSFQVKNNKLSFKEAVLK